MTVRLSTFGIVATIACLALGGTTAGAEQVTIRVKGGGLEVKGELKSFDGAKYVIEAPKLGTVSFDASRIDCLGEACAKRVAPPPMPYEPLDKAAPQTVVVRGPDVAIDTLLPALVRGYAAALGATVKPILGTAPGEAKLRLVDAGGAELATFVLQKDGQAVTALTQGTSAIAILDRQLSDEEAKAIGQAAPEFKPAMHEHTLAGDGLAVIVSPDNPALSLGEDHLARIFSGKAASWIDVGVAGAKITVYGTDKAGGALATLAAAYLKPRNAALAVAVTELGSESEVADAVARDPGGIGVVSFAAQRNARRLNVEGPCGIIARPTSFAVKAGEWPLQRRLIAVTAGPPKLSAARDLVRYAASKDAQAAIADAQLVDDGLESQSLEDQTGRMAAAVNAPPSAFDMGQMKELIADIKDQRRLSMTFRFQPGTIDLDAGSKRQVAQLAELMQSPDYAGKPIQLIGFTDAEGKFMTGVNASTKRAGQVRAAVLAAAGKLAAPGNIAAKGHGALAPVACNDTAEHRQLNRRVEVWVRQP